MFKVIDKNGKYIYADSIVRYWSIDGKKSTIHKVMWCDQKMGYVLSQEGLKNHNQNKNHKKWV